MLVIAILIKKLVKFLPGGLKNKNYSLKDISTETVFMHLKRRNTK